MEIILSSIAVILCWLFIEFFILFFFLFNPDSKNNNYLSLSKFKWIFRLSLLTLFLLIIFYMYYFQTEELKKTIILCIGLIK